MQESVIKSALRNKIRSCDVQSLFHCYFIDCLNFGLGSETLRNLKAIIRETFGGNCPPKYSQKSPKKIKGAT